ncbi:MAG: tetratricopeptide repeat-containing glycosyltransferase [Thermoguttaceae bacterium]
MIVRDEQEVLDATLKTARAIGDELVVLDTSSTDQTPAIAQEHGASLIRGDWQDDASAVRNQLLEHLTGQWVLWLEPGEQLPEASAAELRDFVDRTADPGRVYGVMVELPAADPGGAAEQVAQLRLMPNRPDLWFEGRVRETLRPAIEAAGLEIALAPGRILCHPRLHDPRYRAAKARRDLELARLEYAEKDRPPVRVLLAIGEASSELGDQFEARRALAEALRLAPRGSLEMLEAYYGLLSSLQSDPKDPKRQLAICLEALAVFPLDAQLLCAMGNCLQAQGELGLAARAFDIAVKYGQVNLETWHLREVRQVAAACLSLVLQLSGQDEAARNVLEGALADHPDSVRLRRYLLDLHVKHGRTQEALDTADRLPVTSQGREALRNAVKGACCAARHEWLAALGYLQSAMAAGCSDPLCLRWLTITLLSNGQPEAAMPVLRLWTEIEPNNQELRAYVAACQTALAPAQERPGALTAAEPASVWHRIDPGTTVLQVSPFPMPVISQVVAGG